MAEILLLNNIKFGNSGTQISGTQDAWETGDLRAFSKKPLSYNISIIVEFRKFFLKKSNFCRNKMLGTISMQYNH